MLPLLLACAAAPVDPGPTDTADAAPVPLLLTDALANRVARSDGFGAGIFRVEDPSGSRYAGAVGLRVPEGEPATAEDTFEIASITKTFTAVTVVQLAEEGRLNLDDPFAELLPAWGSGLLVIDGDDLTGTITLRQLLQHTSGLPDYWNDGPYVEPRVNEFERDFFADANHFWTPEEILPYVARLDPLGRPGEVWSYSDTGYVIAGMIIEAIEEQPLHDVMRRRIFSPLGMNDTWMSFREPERPLPDAHRFEVRRDLSTKRHQSADWAGGGLISTTADLDRFLAALGDGALFSDPASFAAMIDWRATGDADLSYGLGLFKIDLDGGAYLWGHDGYGHAFMYAHSETGARYTGGLNQTRNDWWPLVVAALEAE